MVRNGDNDNRGMYITDPGIASMKQDNCNRELFYRIFCLKSSRRVTSPIEESDIIQDDASELSIEKRVLSRCRLLELSDFSNHKMKVLNGVFTHHHQCRVTWKLVYQVTIPSQYGTY